MKINLTGLTHGSFLRCLQILGYVRRLHALDDRGYRDRLRPDLDLGDLADACYLAVRRRDNGRDATFSINLAERILREERNPPPPPAPAPKQEPDLQPGHYYVSVCRNGDLKDYRLLAGPFPCHAEALDKVDKVKQVAHRLDPRAVWYAYGTCRLPLEADPPQGILNAEIKE